MFYGKILENIPKSSLLTLLISSFGFYVELRKIILELLSQLREALLLSG